MASKNISPLLSGTPAGDGCGPPAGGIEAMTVLLLLKHRAASGLPAGLHAFFNAC